jgi:hypothetical protein
MLGAQPKSGTAWRQTEAMLNESYSLFELMTENKGLALEDMLRSRIIPWIKKNRLNNKDEITATLESYEINRIDSRHIKNRATKAVNQVLKRKIIDGELPTPEEQALMMQEAEGAIGAEMQEFGNQRFFKPSEIDEKTWKETFEDMEWDLDIDITGEARNSREELTTLNTALQVIMNPAFESNKKAQAIVGRILENTGAMSPVEYASLPNTPLQAPAPQGAPPEITNVTE